MISSVVLLGSGNVATHMARALHACGLRILQVYSPHREHAQTLAGMTSSQATHRLAELHPGADLYLIAVSDDKIGEVVREMAPVQGFVAHTSGIVNMNLLDKFENFGVFYPLQTFSKKRFVDIRQVPFCIEGNKEKTRQRLFQLASGLSDSVLYIPSASRKQLHLAAVFVNNFPNHLYAAAAELLREKDLDFSILLPLLQETAAKMKELEPGEAQTGPARRNDVNTLREHSTLLEDHPELKEIYQLFSHQILTKYHDKL